jgi:hypothetical protein
MFKKTGTRTAILAFGLALTLSACGGGTEQAVSDAGETASAPATSVVDDRIQAPAVAPGNFSGEAVEVFGQDRVNAGYEETVDYATAITFDEDLLPVREGRTAADFEAATGRMTPSAAEGLRETIRRAVAGDEEAQSSLEGVVFYDLGGDGVTYHASGPIVVNRGITNPSVAVDRSTGSERLQVTFDESGDLRVLVTGSPSTVTMYKTTTYWLTPAPEGSGHTWLIDGIQSSWGSKGAVADTGTY